MNFKVKCVGYNGMERCFTIGKVYDVVNGVIIRDDGFRYYTWSNPACNPKYENSFKGLCNWFRDWYKFELVTESKYKVGDKVKVRSDLVKNRVYGDMYFLSDMCKFRGKTVTIDRVEQNGAYYGIEGHVDTFWTNDMFEGLAMEQNKIVITHDGKTTTATLYREDGSKEVATAKCCPEDTFDFNVGAKLAMERLMKKVAPVEEWRVVDRKPRVGDYIRLKTNGMFNFNEPGDILKVDEVVIGSHVRVFGYNHAHQTTDANKLWNYLGGEYEVVEKVTTTEPKKPEPPKYFNGKVVCVNSGNVPKVLTVGKIYNFTDGCSVSETGCQITSSPIKDCDELNYRVGCTGVKFIPIVE